MDINEIALWRTELFETLEIIEKAIKTLNKAIQRDKVLPAWVYDPESQCLLEDHAARVKACEVNSMLEYVDEQDTRETVTLPGVIGYSDNTLPFIEALNNSKDKFKQVLKAVHGETVVIEVYDKNKRKIEKRISLAKHTLEKMGRGRLNVIQTYRLIKVFSERPQRLGFTWARTNKVEKVTKQQVMRILYNLGDGEEVYAALSTLNEIPEHEYLAYVRPPHLHARANLRWDELEPLQKDLPKQVNCSLPLFFSCEKNQPLPFGSRLEKPKIQKPRQKRVNQKLEASPLFNIVSIFRYLPNFRS